MKTFQKMDQAKVNYLKYGIPSNWIVKYIDKGLTVSSFRKMSKKDLYNIYKLPEHEIEFVKKCLIRRPIDKNTLQLLLERNNFVCCLCKGVKSDAFMIHHIEEYSKTQDNKYDNLAVLCPNDHNEAHKQGNFLTIKITPICIKKAKEKWEKEVENQNVKIASKNGDLHEIDFLNYPRIIELYYNTFGEIPTSRISGELIKSGVISKDGSLNIEHSFPLVNNSTNSYNVFTNSGISWFLRLHYFDLFQKCINKIEFIDLDELLYLRTIKKSNIIGRYCYYVGGLYGKDPDTKNKNSIDLTHLYFRRKGFFVEWKVDPAYLVSNTARSRLADRTIYIIYGLIRNIGKIERNGNEFIYIDIRPYAFGIPNVKKDRTPIIWYLKNQSDHFDNFES